MLQKSIWRSVLLLFLLTVIVFFAVQILFKDKEIFHISDYQYILATSMSNAFVITVIYAIVAAANMLKWSSLSNISFGKIFRITFLPGVLAGILSLCAIFAYFKYADPAGIEQLKNEYLDYSLVQAKAGESYDEVEKIVNSKEVRSTDLLSFRTFTLILAIIIFFNFSLALMLSFLWKIRTTTPK